MNVSNDRSHSPPPPPDVHEGVVTLKSRNKQRPSYHNGSQVQGSRLATPPGNPPPFGHPSFGGPSFTVRPPSTSTSQRFYRGQRVNINVGGMWVQGQVVDIGGGAHLVSSAPTHIRVRYTHQTGLVDVTVPNDPSSIRGLEDD
ncbi:hypothetical protein B0H34DRAFT_802119 [Crassisporium funariophilum]|nr:hypothetical protein B0H34DRAFT_802119 [Crassisporium funariophilum]